MEKKNLKKIALSLGLVGVVGVGATLAALSDTTGNLTNKFVFTSQGIVIALDEAKVDSNNKATSDRITEGNEQTYSNLLPNMVIDKDPTVTVKANSLNCNVFVSVTNSNGEDILKITDLDSTKWTEIDPAEYEYTAQENTTYYVYQGTKATGTVETDDTFKVVPTSVADTVLEDVFQHVQVGNVSGNTTFSNIVIKAAAIQADSQSDEDVAKTALANLGATANSQQ